MAWPHRFPSSNSAGPQALPAPASRTQYQPGPAQPLIGRHPDSDVLADPLRLTDCDRLWVELALVLVLVLLWEPLVLVLLPLVLVLLWEPLVLVLLPLVLVLLWEPLVLVVLPLVLVLLWEPLPLPVLPLVLAKSLPLAVLPLVLAVLVLLALLLLLVVLLRLADVAELLRDDGQLQLDPSAEARTRTRRSA